MTPPADWGIMIDCDPGLGHQDGYDSWVFL